MILSPMLFQENGRTALFHAATQGNIDLVKRLLELGADLNIGDAVCAIIYISLSIMSQYIHNDYI